MLRSLVKRPIGSLSWAASARDVFEDRSGTCHELPKRPSPATAGSRGHHDDHQHGGVVHRYRTERCSVCDFLAAERRDNDDGSGGRQHHTRADDDLRYDITRFGGRFCDNATPEAEVQAPAGSAPARGHVGLEWADARPQRNAGRLDDSARQRRRGSIRLPPPAACDGRARPHRTCRLPRPGRAERDRTHRRVPRRTDRSAFTGPARRAAQRMQCRNLHRRDSELPIRAPADQRAVRHRARLHRRMA